MNKNFILLISILTLNSCNMNNYSDLSDGLYADLETSKGNIILELYYEQAPTTVSNFVALAEGNHPVVDDQHEGKRYYDGLKFHRVIENFMIQGGDPTGTGSGGPGYQFDDEFNEELKHDGPGILSIHLDAKKSCLGILLVYEIVNVFFRVFYDLFFQPLQFLLNNL